jgi:hypothetical protein
VSAREKVFARKAEEIRPLVQGRGSCFATDEIMVKGRPVGYAYREAPDHKYDSGWRFMAGDEADAYMENPDNVGLYDVNTVANYDDGIIALLDAPPGAAFVRDPSTGTFASVEDQDDDDEDAGAPEGQAFPEVEGLHALTPEWAIALPGKFKRRIEEGSLVLWRPGLTTWINVWNNDRKEPADKRVRDIRGQGAPGAFDVVEERAGEVIRYGYRLAEESDDARVAALYAYVVGRSGHVQMAVYFDDEREIDAARAMWRGVRER